MFSSILIANRGEIACRIARTAKRMAIRTVAVYSETDANALHVRECDDAVEIGGHSALESYLNIDKILAAAKQSGCQAIHPGYGFLSENVEFAERCHQTNIVFIGPHCEAIRIMGSKSEARKKVQSKAVPVVPGYDDDNQNSQHLKQAADQIGYPCLIKAVAGGGGKGMRIVNRPSEFDDALESVKRESHAAFSDDRILLEKYLPQSRHVEVQVFGDRHGNYVHMYDRDCSLQRRHQKIIEEAPAPFINESVREKMRTAAIACAKSVNYVGAGTVEFLYTPKEEFYFMEMNTRLQVEHPVTEQITGLDLVEWQLRIASGESLPLKQDNISCSGYAMEARIYAENTTSRFLPSTGTIDILRQPSETEFIRVDSGIKEKDQISRYYDPMICKIVARGCDRNHARDNLSNALENTVIFGIHHNVNFLHHCLNSAAFKSVTNDPDNQSDSFSTQFIDNNLDVLTKSQPEHSLLAELAIAHHHLTQQSESRSPWNTQNVISNQITGYNYMKRMTDDGVETYRFRIRNNHFLFDHLSHPINIEMISRTCIDFKSAGRTGKAWIFHQHTETEIQIDGRHFRIRITDPKDVDQTFEQAHGESGKLTSPMPGLVVDVLATVGDKVTAGDSLIVVEAMKMEHHIEATISGIVESVFCRHGDQIEEGAVLINIQS